MAAVLDFPIRARMSDSDNLESLHAQFAAQLKRFFKSYRLTPADAEDFSQEVFLRLAVSPTGQVLRRPDAFVFTLARNLLRDRARRSYTRASVRSVNVDDTPLDCGLPTPEECLELNQQIALVEETLASLKPAARDAFVRHRVDGESYAEIASHLSVSVSMVEKHIMSALSALRPVSEYRNGPCRRLF